MNYREPKPITREAFEKILAQNHPKKLCSAIVDATHSIMDSAWVEKTCLRLLTHPDEDVRGVAVTCLGHLARIHRQIDVQIVGAAFRALYQNDAKLRGRIQDAVDDIKMFIGEDIRLRRTSDFPSKEEESP